MFVKICVAAAFLLMVALMIGAPLAGASEGMRPIAISATHTSIPLHESASIVVAQEAQSNDSADSESDSSDDDNDNDNGDSEQNAGNDQADQQAAAPQGFRAPDSDADDAGQVPLNAYPQQVNPNQ